MCGLTINNWREHYLQAQLDRKVSDLFLHNETRVFKNHKGALKGGREGGRRIFALHFFPTIIVLSLS